MSTNNEAVSLPSWPRPHQPGLLGETYGRYRSRIVATLTGFAESIWGVTVLPSLRSRYRISTAIPDELMTPSTKAWRPTSSISVLTVSIREAQYCSRGAGKNDWYRTAFSFIQALVNSCSETSKSVSTLVAFKARGKKRQIIKKEYQP